MSQEIETPVIISNNENDVSPVDGAPENDVSPNGELTPDTKQCMKLKIALFEEDIRMLEGSVKVDSLLKQIEQFEIIVKDDYVLNDVRINFTDSASNSIEGLKHRQKALGAVMSALNNMKKVFIDENSKALESVEGAINSYNSDKYNELCAKMFEFITMMDNANSADGKTIHYVTTDMIDCIGKSLFRRIFYIANKEEIDKYTDGLEDADKYPFVYVHPVLQNIMHDLFLKLYFTDRTDAVKFNSLVRAFVYVALPFCHYTGYVWFNQVVPFNKNVHEKIHKIVEDEKDKENSKFKIGKTNTGKNSYLFDGRIILGQFNLYHGVADIKNEDQQPQE